MRGKPDAPFRWVLELDESTCLRKAQGAGLVLLARARRTMRPRNMLVAALIALVLGLLSDPLTGLCLALLAALVCMVETGTKVVLGEPPARFAHAPPGAVLVASRNSGLILGLTSGLAVLLTSLLASLAIGSDLSGWLLLLPLSGGLQIGLRNGLGAWLYHHWLRRTLHRQACSRGAYRSFWAGAQSPHADGCASPTPTSFVTPSCSNTSQPHKPATGQFI